MLHNTCDLLNVEFADGKTVRLFSALQKKRWRNVPFQMWHLVPVPAIAHSPEGVADSHLFVDPATFGLLVGTKARAHARDDGYVTHVSVETASSPGGSRKVT
jgi:hypothetical protein